MSGNEFFNSNEPVSDDSVQPIVAPQSPETVAKVVGAEPAKPWMQWLLIAVACFVAIRWFDGSFRQDRERDDQQQVIDDDRKQDNVEPVIDTTGADLVLVYERTSPTVEQVELVQTAVDAEWIKSHKLRQSRLYDEEQEDAKPFTDYAASKNITAPFMALTKAEGDKRKIVAVAPWPADKAALDKFASGR